MGRTGRGLSLYSVYSLPPYSFLRAPDYWREYSPGMGVPPPKLGKVGGWTGVESDIFQPHISGTSWFGDALGCC